MEEEWNDVAMTTDYGRLTTWQYRLHRNMDILTTLDMP